MKVIVVYFYCLFRLLSLVSSADVNLQDENKVDDSLLHQQQNNQNEYIQRNHHVHRNLGTMKSVVHDNKPQNDYVTIPKLTKEQKEVFWLTHRIVQPIPTRAVRDIAIESTYIVDTTFNITRTKANPLLKGRQPIRFVRRGEYAGIGFTEVHPPDPTGAVGTTQYVQAVNNRGSVIVSIRDKKTGSIQNTFVLGELVFSVSESCSSARGDPIVMFDQYAKRWILAELDNTVTGLCFYISKTDDAIGPYMHYHFQTTDSTDYHKYGVWTDAYYVGTNGAAPGLHALEREAILAWKPAKIVSSYVPQLTGFQFQMLPPVDASGPILPATDIPGGIFVRHVDDEVHKSNPDPKNDQIEIWTLSVNFTTSKATAKLQQVINVPEFSSDLCGLTSFNCVPQPGTDQQLDPLREVIMNRPQYRNYIDYESMVLVWTVDVNGKDKHGTYWTELRRSNGGKWELYQQQTYSPDSVNRWIPSIAMNGCGDIAIGYSVSDSKSTYPGLRINGRFASDPLSTLSLGEQSIVTARSSQKSSERWGDYANMAVDPVDDKTFWFTSEYALNGEWDTRIISFTLDNSGVSCSIACSGGYVMYKKSMVGLGVCTERCVKKSNLPAQSKNGWKVGRCV